jgi:hypothetical protein
LTGFAAGWSVLEFLFILMELARNLTTTPKGLMPFELYGEGVMLTVASVICALQQEWFIFAANMSRRFQMVHQFVKESHTRIEVIMAPKSY